MAQIFGARATVALRAALVSAAAVLAGGLIAGMVHVRSGSFWNVGTPAPQPIPFQHSLHAGALGLDCRFCHNTVEHAAAAAGATAFRVWTGYRSH